MKPPSTNAVDAVRRLRCAAAAGAVACAVAAACAGRAAKSEAARKAQATPAARMPTANALMLFMIGALLSPRRRHKTWASRAQVEVRAYQLISTTHFRPAVMRT